MRPEAGTDLGQASLLAHSGVHSAVVGVVGGAVKLGCTDIRKGDTDIIVVILQK